jgi:hypothetical protein
VAEQIRDPMRDDAGFTAAGPGKHKLRTVDVRDGVALGVGQAEEEVVGGSGRGQVRSQESGVRSQESGVRSQESGVRSQEWMQA